MGTFRVYTQGIGSPHNKIVRFQVNGEQNSGRWTYASIPLNSTTVFRVTMIINMLFLQIL